MTSSKQEYSELNLDRGLRDVRVVVKNSVVGDFVDDAVEDIGIDAYSSPVLVEVSVTPVVQEVYLRRLHDGRVLTENPRGEDFSA